MLKKLFILITLAVAGTTSFAQIVHPDLIGKKIAIAIKQEQQLKSKTYTSDEDIIIPGGMAVPVRFIRKEKDIPNLIVQYIFSEKDSIIYNIAYEWDVRVFEKSDHDVRPLAFDQALIARYNSLVNFFTQRYGTGITKGDLSDLTKIKALGGLAREDRWKADGLPDIWMYTAISNHYEAITNGARIPTHKIRVYISKPRK